MKIIAFILAIPVALAAALAWMITISRRATRLFANVNTFKMGLNQNVRWFPCPTGITSGMPVLIGTIPAVAVDAYDSSTGGTDFWTDGSYFLTVIGQSSLSPVANLQVNPGDALYAQGTYDPVTNITYSLTIDKTNGNALFGNYDGSSPIAAGATNTYAPVRIPGQPGTYAQ